MSYKMDYGTNTYVISSTQIVKKKSNRGLRRCIVLGVIVALIIVCATTDILIPGDAAITKAAMSEFVSDIKGGEQVVDAFAVFCQTVLQGG